MTIVAEDQSVDTIRRIVEAASLAPSAENTQPWKFIAGPDSLTVCLDPARALPSDLGYMLALTALGAAIENSVLKAGAMGLAANVKLLAGPELEVLELLPVPIARIRFADRGVRDHLADRITLRCTGRRMDPRKKVEVGLLVELMNCIDHVSDVRVHWVDQSYVPEFARLVGLGNRIRFEHEPFHRELFENLRFTSAEARRTRDGLDVKTLQLPLGVASILKTLRNWPQMKWANAFGLSRAVSLQAGSEVRRSGAVGFITVKSPTVECFIEGGRVFERLWLTASSLRLLVHPTASLPVFLMHARANCERLLPKHKPRVENMTKKFNELFPDVSARVVQMAFRLGYGPSPRARSLRRNVQSLVSK